MKKLFISVPMKNRTTEAIKNSIDIMHKIAELEFGEDLEIIDSYFEEYPSDAINDKNKSIWYLGKSIQKLAEADYFIGVYTHSYAGCKMELNIAESYNIPTITLDTSTCKFLADVDAVEQQYIFE